jgi:hypothetical protein
MQGNDDANQLIEGYLTPAGMTAARAALIERYAWFLHASDADRFGDIKKEGLKPHNPGCAPHQLAVNHLGDTAREILCLRPLTTFDTTPNRGNSRIVFAVGGDSLPHVISLDWSYAGAWNLPAIIKKEEPHLTDEQVFCESIRRWGSVASYAGINPHSLRVRCKGMSEDDPASWPLLPSVQSKDLHVF